MPFCFIEQLRICAFTVLQMTAVITKSGDLKIISGPEDSSDAEGKLNSS